MAQGLFPFLDLQWECGSSQFTCALLCDSLLPLAGCDTTHVLAPPVISKTWMLSFSTFALPAGVWLAWSCYGVWKIILYNVLIISAPAICALMKSANSAILVWMITWCIPHLMPSFTHGLAVFQTSIQMGTHRTNVQYAYRRIQYINVRIVSRIWLTQTITWLFWRCRPIPKFWIKGCHTPEHSASS